MISLLLLFLSGVLSVVLINIIPFGLGKIQKKVISITAPVIGSLGLAFSLIASTWQSVLVMSLLAVSAGYVLISRTTENLEFEEAISRGIDTGYLPKAGVHHELPKSVDQDDKPSLKEVPYSNVVSPAKQAEDISFLELRNNSEFEMSELEVIPLLNFEGTKEEIDDVTSDTLSS